MYTLVYISNAIQLFEERELEELFASTKASNSLKNITGILLYRDGTFMQIMEGNQEDVEKLFKTIERDPRHNNILRILQRNIEKPLFSHYQTGFSVFKNYKELDNFEIFLKQHENSSHANSILALLTPFLNERKLMNDSW